MAANNRIHMQNDGNDVHPLAPGEISREAFGRKLYDLMLKKGWTQSELGRRAGITRGSISNYILGHAVPTDLNVARLAKALNVSMDSLRPSRVEEAIEEDTPSVEFRISSADQSKAWLRVNRLVSVAAGAKILQILNDDAAASNAE